MTQVVIYTRFSPRRNADESSSCEVQEGLCRKLAEERGWTVKAVHADKAVSGGEWPRAGLTAALADLQKGDVLLVYRRDRIARQLRISETVAHMVRRTGARIVAVEGDIAGESESPEAVLFRQLLASLSEYERKLIGARTKASMLQQQRSGRRVGRFPPYGFAFDPADHGRLVENPTEQRAAERARELVAGGMSFSQAARALDKQLPEAARGKNWHHKTVEKIVRRSE